MTRPRLTAIALIAGTATSALAADAHLPLTHLTLYRSGVGSFTHIAAIEGAETFELTFDTKHVDDILKSLLLLDADKGSTTSVSYQSSEDLARRLNKFSININQATGIDDLFAQLRGVEIDITTPDTTLTGTILGVESRNVRRTGAADTVNVRMVNLVTPKGIRSVAIDDIVNFEFTDDEITQELNRALQTLVDNRTDNLRDMAITFATNSTNRRNVAVSYVHEMPVWKTAYRLVIPRDKDAGKDAKDSTLTLQAWAIIENTTAADWTDVRLSLAAGRPVSFTMNLDEAIYANRPTLPVPIGGSLSAMLAKSADHASGNTLYKRWDAESDSAGAPMRSLQDTRESASRVYPSAPAISLENMGDAQSSGGQEGGLFLFTLDEPLNLAAQQSAMLPIANTAIEGEPISLYNASVAADTPFLAVRLTNDTGLHLMPGPVTIFDGERYAGDAQTDHIARGGDAQLTYAADLDLNVSRTRKSDSFDITWSINDGLLIRKTGQEITWTYTAKNSDANDRTLIIDHVKAFGPRGVIIAPEDPDENREPTISREIEIEAGDTAELVIKERQETDTTYRMGDFNIETVIASATEGSLSNEVITALRTVAAKRQTIAEHEAAIARDTNLINEIIRDQSRIRNNMASLDRNSELYRTYYSTLNSQENQLATVRADLENHRDNLESAQRDLRDYLNNLTIE